MKPIKSLLKSVTGEMIPTEQAIFTKAWTTLKQHYYITQDDGDEWNKVINEYKDIYNTGDNPATEELSHRIAVAVLKYLEVISKNRTPPRRG